MIHAQRTKYVRVCEPAAIVDNASFACTEIDTLGFDYCQIVCQLGATDITMAALKVQENAVSATSLADVTGLIYGTSDNIAGSTSALPDEDADDQIFVFEIDLRGRLRYLNLVATAGNGSAGTFMAAFALLSRAGTLTDTAAGRITDAGDIVRV